MKINHTEIRYREILKYVIGKAIESLEDYDERECMLILSLLRKKIIKGEVFQYYQSLVFDENAKQLDANIGTGSAEAASQSDKQQRKYKND